MPSTLSQTLGITTSVPVPSYRGVVLADSPLAYYPLDETSGTVAHDISGNANHGTIAAGVTLGFPGLVPNDVGTAMLVDGSMGHIQLPGAVQIQSPLTYEVWANTANFGAGEGGYILASDPGVRFLIDTSGKVAATIQVAGVWYNPSRVYTTQLSTSYHLVLGVNASNTAYFYVNGAFINSGTATSGVITYTANPLAIGADFFGNWHAVFNGRLQHVAIYGNLLSSTQIQNHYTTGLRMNGTVPSNNPAILPTILSQNPSHQ